MHSMISLFEKRKIEIWRIKLKKNNLTKFVNELLKRIEKNDE